MYDKAVEEIKEIFRKNCDELEIFKVESEEQLDKDLSDFLKRFEEGLLEAGMELARENEPI